MNEEFRPGTDDFPAILSVDTEHPPIKGAALIVRERGRNLFLERVADPSWEDLRRVASRAIFHCEDPDHCFVEIMLRVTARLAAKARLEADQRGIRETESVWEFFLGS